MPRRGSPYDRKWQRLRAVHLRAEPLCRMCADEGRAVPATVVDHVVPVRAARDRRLDPANLQSLCDFHHSAVKQREEARGYSPQSGPDGWPVDPRHPANAAGRGRSNP